MARYRLSRPKKYSSQKVGYRTVIRRSAPRRSTMARTAPATSRQPNLISKTLGGKRHYEKLGIVKVKIVLPRSSVPYPFLGSHLLRFLAILFGEHHGNLSSIDDLMIHVVLRLCCITRVHVLNESKTPRLPVETFTTNHN